MYSNITKRARARKLERERGERREREREEKGEREKENERERERERGQIHQVNQTMSAWVRRASKSHGVNWLHAYQATKNGKRLCHVTSTTIQIPFETQKEAPRSI